jgi:hypothetical protein
MALSSFKFPYISSYESCGVLGQGGKVSLLTGCMLALINSFSDPPLLLRHILGDMNNEP